MSRLVSLFILVLIGFFSAGVVLADDQFSPNFQNRATTYSPTTFDATSPSFRLNGSLDSIVGEADSASFQNTQGVPLREIIVTPTPTPTPAGTSGAGGGSFTYPAQPSASTGTTWSEYYIRQNPPTLTYPRYTFRSAERVFGTRDRATTDIWVNGSTAGVSYPDAVSWERRLPLSLGVNLITVQAVGMGSAPSEIIGGQIERLLIGDVNRDHVVNDVDLSKFTRATKKYSVFADFNQDGKVDGRDLSLLASHWLASNEIRRPVAAASAQIKLSGPSQIRPGQLFQVVISEQGFHDIDTIRLNGSFTSPLLAWDHAQAQNIFQNISPGTTVDQDRGLFSFGAYGYDALSASGGLAVVTFKALAPGTAKITLDTTTRVYANGEPQPVTPGSLTIQIAGAPSAGAFPTVGSLTVRSASHPEADRWYPQADVDINWTVASDKAYKTFIGLDQDPQGEPTQQTSAVQARLYATGDGVWYAHVKAVYDDGTSDQVDLPVRVDQTPPATLVPSMDQDTMSTSMENTVRFAASDAASGINTYVLFFDRFFVTSTSQNAYTFSGYSIGRHTIRIVATDRAGNTTEGSTAFEVFSEGAVTPPAAAVPTVLAPVSAAANVVRIEWTDWWYPIMIVFLAIAGAAVFFLEKKSIRMKKKPIHRSKR